MRQPITSTVLNPAKLGGNQAAGIVVWLISAYATALFVGQIGIKEPISYALGLGLQYLFTRAEIPIWRRQGWPILGVIVTAIDSLLNAVGIWPYVRDNLGTTDLWRLAVDLTGDTDPPTLAVRFLVVAVVGLAVAAAPEYFWSRKD